MLYLFAVFNIYVIFLNIFSKKCVFFGTFHYVVNMKNILIALWQNQNKCKHKNALLHTNEGYCPDCGQYLVKNYYLIRCSRCEIKREARLSWGEIVPLDKFCSNCGSVDYYIEKLDSVNFIDAKYALYIKEIAQEMQILHPETQIWVEEGDGIVKQITAS